MKNFKICFSPRLKALSLILSVMAATTLIVFVVFAQVWTEPTQAPPGGNVAAPINVSATAQTKTGALTVQGTINANDGVRTDGNRAISADGSFHSAYHYDNTHYGYFEVRRLDGQRGAYFGYGTPGSYVSLRLENGNNLYISGGNVGIGATTPTSILHTVASGAKTADYIGNLLTNTATSSTASVVKTGLSVTSTGTWNGTTAVNRGLYVNATGGTTNYAAIFEGGNVGIGTLNPGTYKLNVNGNVWASEYHCSAGDVAEKIPTANNLLPGDVVCLDEENEGKLSYCDESYDNKVAGVISTVPGILLGNNEDVASIDNANLALAGKVPVKASAENGPIEVGDLLVSSSRHGYAMRGEKEIVAQMPGVVLGKAMESLDSGEGEILMLVILR